MVDDLEKKKSFVEKFAFTDTERYWHYLHHLLSPESFFKFVPLIWLDGICLGK
jgi:hypothetical protein